MKVGFYQFKPRLLGVEHNLETVSKALNRVECDLMVLPELFSSGYDFSDREELAGVAEDVPGGPTTEALIKISKENDMAIVAGVAEQTSNSFYNSAVVVDKKFVGVYRKVHLFGTEKRFFKPGSRFKVFKVRGAKVGVMVCFDWFFPESMRTLALMGAEIIAHPANLVMPYCPDAMITRCLENRVYAVTADRIGVEGKLKFIGKSQVTGPDGGVIYRAGSDTTECKVFEIDPEKARNKRLNKYNNIIRDRNPRAYRL
ncbi:MAG: nitrilase-related carbon-nitrogen hydrolase [Candidatus Altiarchaeota archaeon]